MSASSLGGVSWFGWAESSLCSARSWFDACCSACSGSVCVWPISCCSSDSSSPGLACGSCVARGPNTSLAARAACSWFTSITPSRAAAQRAAFSANTGARREYTPSAKAAAHRACTISSGAFTVGKSALACAMFSAVHSKASAPGVEGLSCTKNANRSSSAKGTCSSSPMPSSSATTPKRAGSRKATPSRSMATSCVSITPASRAAVPSGTRSAMASMTTPPSARASTPACTTGRPALRVAPKSRPPSNAASLMFSGIRCSGV